MYVNSGVLFCLVESGVIVACQKFGVVANRRLHRFCSVCQRLFEIDMDIASASVGLVSNVASLREKLGFFLSARDFHLLIFI